MDPEVCLEAERIEQAFTKTFCRPLDDAPLLDGVAYYHEPASDCLLVVSPADVLYVNRVLGAGLHEPVSETLLRQVQSCYIQYGTKRYFIQPAPQYGDESGKTLTRLGGQLYSNWVKLLKVPQPQQLSHIPIRQATEADYEAMAGLLVTAFGWPNALKAFDL